MTSEKDGCDSCLNGLWAIAITLLVLWLWTASLEQESRIKKLEQEKTNEQVQRDAGVQGH